jgi:hypothetical protein
MPAQIALSGQEGVAAPTRPDVRIRHRSQSVIDWRAEPRE